MRVRRILTAALVLALAFCGITIPRARAEYNMPFYIEVDITNQIVTIYKTEDDTIVRQMICSSGMNDCTPLGDYFMCAAKMRHERTPWQALSVYDCFVKYASRIYRGYLFHSIPFKHRDNSTMDMEAYNQLGTPTSHGCIRLRVEDSKFISDYCRRGTYVKIYKSGVVNEELRQLLLVSSYRVEDGIPYMEYMGYSENELGRGSSGEHVADIQARMRALGYYDGEISGQYDLATLTAVKKLQSQLGFAQNGIASQGFQDVLFSDEAPVSRGTIPLRDGSSGPVVEQLQQALTELGVYAGNIDGIYDLEVNDAVMLFQSACGYTVDGVATPEVQQTVYYECAQIREALGTDAPAQMEIERESVEYGKVSAGNSLSIRMKPDASANSLTHLRAGERALIVKASGDWSAVVAKGVKGYARNKFLIPETQDNVILRYSANEKEYAIGHTMEEYLAGAQSVAQEFPSIRAAENFAADEELDEEYVAVDTGEDSVSLNLRAQPQGDAEVLAQIPNATRLYVLSRGDGWTKVTYQEHVGYLMNAYLNFDLPDEAEDMDDLQEAVCARVLSTDGSGKAPVFDAGSADANLLGHLPADVQVEIVSASESDGWVHIRYRECDGWMPNANLKFEM